MAAALGDLAPDVPMNRYIEFHWSHPASPDGYDTVKMRELILLINRNLPRVGKDSLDMYRRSLVRASYEIERIRLEGLKSTPANLVLKANGPQPNCCSQLFPNDPDAWLKVQAIHLEAGGKPPTFNELSATLKAIDPEEWDKVFPNANNRDPEVDFLNTEDKYCFADLVMEFTDKDITATREYFVYKVLSVARLWISGSATYIVKTVESSEERGAKDIFGKVVAEAPIEVVRYVLLTAEKMRSLCSCVTIRDGNKEIDLWKEVKKILGKFPYKTVVCTPYARDKPPKLPQSFNRFRGYRFAYLAKNGRDDAGIAMINRYVFEVACARRPGLYALFLDVLATRLCDPLSKLGFAIVCLGVQGIMKTRFWQVVARILGDQHSMSFSSVEALCEKFNEWEEESLLTILEEAGRRQALTDEQQNIIKDKITNVMGAIRGMGKASRQARLRALLIFISNRSFPFEMSETDRRFLVLLFSREYRPDRRNPDSPQGRKSVEFTTAVIAAFDSDHAIQSWYSWLVDRYDEMKRVGRTVPLQAPVTVEGQRIVDYFDTPERRWLAGNRTGAASAFWWGAIDANEVNRRYGAWWWGTDTRDVVEGAPALTPNAYDCEREHLKFNEKTAKKPENAARILSEITAEQNIDPETSKTREGTREPALERLETFEGRKSYYRIRESYIPDYIDWKNPDDKTYEQFIPTECRIAAGGDKIVFGGGDFDQHLVVPEAMLSQFKNPPKTVGEAIELFNAGKRAKSLAVRMPALSLKPLVELFIQWDAKLTAVVGVGVKNCWLGGFSLARDFATKGKETVETTTYWKPKYSYLSQLQVHEEEVEPGPAAEEMEDDLLGEDAEHVEAVEAVNVAVALEPVVEDAM